jgi:tetratricopeptide (TPR) repeat protein
MRARRYAEAIPPLERAVGFAEDHRATGNLARAYWLVGQRQKANELYRRAIRQAERELELNPAAHGVHLLIGRYHAMLGQKDRAISHLDLALHGQPDDPHYLTIAAVAYTRLGENNIALTLLEKAQLHGNKAVNVRAEPELDVLGNSPRYMALLSETQ